jgi:hypothetical protein
MSYIGNSPGVASQRVTTTITATAGQTQFTTLSGYILGYVDVYLNGAKLINGVDFEAITGTYITLFTGAVVNDVVELVSYIPRGLTDGYTKAEADAKFLDVTGDIATGTLSIKNATISAQNDSVANWAYTSTLGSITNPNDIYFKPDGLKMFVTTASVITQYALTTAWDTTTATAGTTFSMSAIDTGTLGLFFSPDGTKMVTCGTTGVVIANGSGVAGEDRAYYFTLSTAWDVTTATLVNSIRFAIGDAGGIPAALTSPQAVDLNSDGTIMYILDSTTDYVNQFALSTAYNVNTATYTKRLLVSTEEAGGTALRFNSTGTRMYLVGTTGDDVNEYRLTTAWDIATAIYYDKFYLGWYELTPAGLYISESANAAFICGTSTDAVLKFATDKYELQLSAETASSKIDLAGNTRVLNNFAVDGNSYFDGTIVTSSTLTGANITANQITTTTTAITLGGSVSTGATALTTTQSTGTITVGGTAATGAITLGQSTAAQTLNLGTGATASGSTKTINIGTAGLSGSTTAIQIGSAVSGATNTTTINGDLLLGGTTASGKLTVDPGSISGTRIDGLHLPKNLTAQANYVAWQQGIAGWRAGIVYNDSTYPLAFYYGASTPTASAPGTELMRVTSSGDLTITGSLRSFASPAFSLAANQFTDIMYIGAGGYGAIMSGILTVYSTYSGAVTQNSYFVNVIGHGGGTGISMLSQGNYSTPATTIVYDRSQVLGGGSRVIAVYNATGTSIAMSYSFSPVGANNSAAYYSTLYNTGTAGAGTGIPSGDAVYFGQNYAQIKAANIIFPSSQSASSDANTLDDYEESTWTPAINGCTVTVARSSVTKIGRLVTVSATITLASVSGSGALQITNMPYPGTNSEFTGSIMLNNVVYTGDPVIYCYPPNQFFEIYLSTSNGIWVQLTNSNLSVNDTLIFSITYIAT